MAPHIAGLKPSSTCVIPVGLGSISRCYPALKRWANLFRAYGARPLAPAHQLEQPRWRENDTHWRHTAAISYPLRQRAGRTAFPRMGWATVSIAHTSPGTLPGILVSDQVRLTTVAPQSSRTGDSPDADKGNEGAPFRCLSLHTHQKLWWKRRHVSARMLHPATPETGVASNPGSVTTFCRMEVTTAQPDTAQAGPNRTRRTLLI